MSEVYENDVIYNEVEETEADNFEDETETNSGLNIRDFGLGALGVGVLVGGVLGARKLIKKVKPAAKDKVEEIKEKRAQRKAEKEAKKTEAEYVTLDEKGDIVNSDDE